VRNRRLWICAGMLSIAVDSVPISTAQTGADQLIQSRIANFREMGTAYKYIGDEMTRRQPHLFKIQESAQLIKNRGADMLHWFPHGSEPPPQARSSWLDTILGWFSTEDSFTLATGAKSHAKRTVWTERQKFEEANSKFQAQADRMWQAAQTGQATAISAQFKRLGETCKGCHDVYREKLD
jgi:cytochrome c556